MSSAKKFQGYNQRQPQVAAAATTTTAHVKLLAAAKISQWHKGVASQSGSRSLSSSSPWPSRVESALVCSWLGLCSYFKRAHSHTEAQRHLLLLAHRVKRTIVHHCVLAGPCRASLSSPLRLVTRNVLTFWRAHISKANYMRS